jgi:hypothetical protein
MPTQRHETTSSLLSARPRRQSARDDVAVDPQTISTIHDTATSLSRQQRYCIRPRRGIKHPTPVDCSLLHSYYFGGIKAAEESLNFNIILQLRHGNMTF